MSSYIRENVTDVFRYIYWYVIDSDAPSRSGSVVRVPGQDSAASLREDAASPESLLSAASLPPSSSIHSPKPPGTGPAMSTLTDTGKR